MYKSRQIADWIIHKTHGNITHSKLQKLLYYCQAWHYTIFNEVLFDERIEAWTHGPVVPSLELLVKREDPWRETRGNIPEFKKCQKEIRLDLMKQYYINLN